MHMMRDGLKKVSVMLDRYSAPPTNPPPPNDLRSIMGCPGGMSTIRCTRLVLEIWSFRLSLYISREKSDHHYIQTRHNDLFYHYNLILRKL